MHSHLHKQAPLHRQMRLLKRRNVLRVAVPAAAQVAVPARQHLQLLQHDLADGFADFLDLMSAKPRGERVSVCHACEYDSDFWQLLQIFGAA
jgi:hypothetical protein